MRRTTFIKRALFVVMFLFNIISFSQNLKPFTPRFDRDIRGDMFLIGNNILNRDTNSTNPNDPYNGGGVNGDFTMNYIDIDGDPSTFNSSSARIASPRPNSDNCYKIIYAGLYWGATLQSGSRTNINRVKFKLPTGGYIDITGEVIHDANPTPIGGDNMRPYACYADVTNLIAPLANPVGNYTVANVVTSQGSQGGTGLSAGWSLFLVYEDPTLTSKSIVSFDGFSGIGGAATLDVPISGFRTIPVGPVRAKFAMTALEGDQQYTGDYLRINGNTISQVTAVPTTLRPANNFFNSSITDINGYMNAATQRTPNSSNTLGYDAAVLNVNNAGNAVIGNNATTATIRLGSTLDVYFYFFNAFAVDIIAPEIQLTKNVEDAAGNDIGGADVTLGQQLNYEIGFQNIGNDNATSFTIKDVLPVNIIFDPADLALPGALPPGVTFTYNAATREIVFTIPNNLVEVGDPRFVIRIRVHVVQTCLEMDDACSNLIQNQAFATYSGTYNTAVFSDEGSIASFGACGFGTPGSTNFLVGLDNCDFSRTEVLCSSNNPSLVLTAANGYESYLWSGPGVNGATTQSVTITQPGTYTVNDIINLSPCKSIVETINVIGYGIGVTNPVIPYADQVVTCVNDGTQLPYIFLCGANDAQLIETNITGAVSIVWEQLNETTCTETPALNCANTAVSCEDDWFQVGTGANFNVTSAGQYRVVITFQGNCERTFFFNAYENVLEPTYISRDIICTTAGQITVNDVPAGYEYSLSPTGPWQASNVFPINTAGIYTVYIRQVGVTAGCVFTIPNIGITVRDFTVSAILTQPLCNGDKGSINLAANDVEPQYTFSIYQGATLINTTGPIVSNNYVFSNLNPGNYSYVVTTQDGCNATANFTIIDPPVLSVTAALTRPLSCTDGEITVYPVGGTAPYTYIVTGAISVTQTDPVITVTTAGTYNIQVIDTNNCTANTSITVNQVLPPAYTVVDTDIQCANSGNTGVITINVSNANGNTLMYSIDNGASFSSSNVFSNLAPGTYNVVVQYTFGTAVCTTAPQAVTITAPTPLTATAILNPGYTCEHPGTITVTASGGTPGYTYSIDGVTFQAGNTFTVNAAGTYVITVRDNNGCTTTTTPVVVPALNGPTDLIILIQDQITCPTNTGTLNAQLPNYAGGLPPIRFLIIAPPAFAGMEEADGVFHNLPAGTYTFQVIDRNGCTYQEDYTFLPLPPTVITPQVTNVSCIGTATGSASFTISGIPNDTDYSYTINGVNPRTNGTTPVSGSTTFVVNLTNLTAGSYTISLYNEANECTYTSTVTVAAPAAALAATVTSSPVTCNTNGQVIVNATGGWGGYNYSISPVAGSQSGNTFSNLPAGTYTITTTDANGCQVTNTVTLTAPTQPSLALSATSDFCYDSTNGATLVVTASGGVAPYQFSINGGAFQTSNTFSNLTPGTYTIVVRDAYGCTNSAPFTQTINPQLTVNTVLTKDLDCSASPNAVISGTVTGGYPGYTYQVNVNNTGFVNLGPVTGTTFTYTTASSGTYQFQVTDTRGCIAQSGVITVPVLTNPTATHVVTNVTCNGLSNGSVTITPSSGTAPYQISFNGGAFSSTTTYSGLAAGTYTYIVRDSKQCTFNGSFTITQPTPVVVSASLTTQYTCTSSGVITVTASGGTGAITYSINGVTFQAGNTFTVTAAGTYTITVRDANGCTATTNVVVTPLTPPTDISFSATAVTCTAGNTSNVTLTVTGGSAPLTYQIIAPSVGTPQASNVFNNLAPGTYTFQVTDSRNCTYQENFTINPLPPLSVSAVVNSNIQCSGSATGSISFTVTGFNPTFNYTITPNGFAGDSGTNIGTSTVTVNNLLANTYTINIVNPTTGCTATTSITISGPAAPLTATLTTTPVTCSANGSVTVNASGGWGGYTYAISPVAGTQSGNIFSNIPSGSYTITIVDANGCSIQRPFTLVAPVQPTLTLSATSDFCYDTANGATIVVTASSGVAPYEFSINGGAFVPSNTPVNGHTFSNLTSGTYTITVRDAFGCTNAVPFTQTINPQLTLSTVLTKDFDCTASPNGVISGTISGGYPGYTYQVNYNGGGYGAPISVAASTFTYSIPTTNPGTYQILVTDSRGCTVQSGVITIPALVPVTVTSTQVNVLCFGDSTGSVTFTPGGGVGPYQINFNGLGFSSNTTYSNLAAGTYTVIVRDSKMCTVSTTITITQNPQITYTPVVTPIQCTAAGTTLGGICVQGLTGGVAPYTYTLVDLTGGNPTQTFNAATAGIDHCFTNLDYGYYDLSVTDANGCTITNSNIQIASPVNGLNVTTTVVPGICTSGATVVVQALSPFGTSGPYYFSLYPTSTLPPAGAGWQPEDAPGTGVSTFSGLLTGVTYSFIIWDQSTNCFYYAQANTSTASNSLITSTIDVVNNVSCIGSADGNVNITINGYSGTSVSWQIFNSVTTTPVGPVNNVVGLPGGPFTISNIGPMAPGSYFVLFTETSGPNSGCAVSSAIFNITESLTPLTISASAIKNDNCNPNAGVISVVGQGGTSPYTYSIDGVTYVTASTFNVESGTYTVYVRDAFGCIVSTTVTVNLDPTPNIDVALINACAVEGNFSVNVTLNTTGISPYSLSVDGGAFQTVAFPYMVNGLSSGAHTIQVQDSNGCGETVNFNILTPLLGSSAITALPTCANNDGEIVVTPSGGSGNYSYSISPATGTITGTNPATISGLAAGNYTVTITDTTTNCTFNIPVTLGAPTPVTFTTTSTMVSCNGGSDGTITVVLDASNNNPVYSYTITAGPGAPYGPQSSNVFTGLQVGTYTVVVNSGRGCSATQNVPVNEPTAVSASASVAPFTCAPDNSANTATLTITATGGTAPYTYSINGTAYFTSNTFQIVDNGSAQNITVYVQDANGCIATNTIIVNPLPRITSATINQVTAITCTNPEVVSVAVVGGSGSYTYQLLPSVTTQVSNIFNLPAPGTYTIQINDTVTGCYTTATYTVNPFNNLDVTALLVDGVSCLGGTDGSISIDVQGYSGAYTYTVLDASNNPVLSGTGNTTTNPFTITGLATGNYTVQVTETASPFCTEVSGIVNVTTPSSAVGIQLVSNINANCNDLAQVTVIGTGGTPGYTYAFMQNGVVPVLANYGASNTASLDPVINTLWDVYVMDANGCTTFIDVTIATDPLPTITLPAIAADQCTSTGATYTFTATGTGIAPLTYSIGGAFQSSPTFTVTSSATPYTVTVMDGNGCTANASITIYPVLGVVPSITALPSCANNDGVITLNASGGSGNYSYSISPITGVIAGNIISGLPSGTYTVTVTDTVTLCQTTATVTLSAATPVTFTATSTAVICNGDSNGTITITLDAGNNDTVYTYQITNPIAVGPQTSNVFTGLAAGTYDVLVTSGRNCTATLSVVVGTPTVLVASATATAFGCAADNSVNTSTVTITGTGGTTAYTYSIDGVNYYPTNTFNITDNGLVQNITVYVKDANGCIDTEIVTINPLPAFVSATVVQDIAITCLNPEQVHIDVVGGSGNFTYQLLPSGTAQASNVFTLSTPGAYTFQVNDLTTGCYIITAPYNVAPYDTIVVTATPVDSVTCFGGNNGSISVSVTGYTGAYSYNVLDSNGLVVASGVGNTSVDPITVSGLTGGSYTVQITETATPFCNELSNVVTVGSPAAALTVTAVISAPLTCDPNTGQITATAVDGWGSYEYELVGPVNVAYSTNNVFGNLPAGVYTVNVRDLRGCIASTTVTFVDPTPIVATFTPSATTVACYGDTNVSIFISYPTGGQGSNYSYIFNTISPVTSSSGPITIPVGGATITGVGAGTYNITIIDGFNCSTTSANIVITQPTQVTATLSMTNTPSCDNPTVLTLTASGGTAPYTYSADNVTYSAATFNPSVAISLPVGTTGTFSYYVRDANGCVGVISNDVQIDPIPTLTLTTLTDSDILCGGSATGSIIAVAEGGLGNYTYSLVDGSGNPIAVGTQSSPGVFTNLPVGTYYVHVVSNSAFGTCLYTSAAVTISEPPVFVTAIDPDDVKCNGGSDGTVTITTSGGTGIVKYAISPNLDQFFTIPTPASYTVEGLAAGNYTIIIQDQNGCFNQYDFTVGQPTILTSAITNVVNETCAEDDLAEITVNNIGGGTAPYTLTYTVVYPGTTNVVTSPIIPLAAGQTSYVFTNLNGGIYTTILTDANGCTSTNETVVGSGVLYDPQALVTFPCVGNAPAVEVEVLNMSNTPSNNFVPMSDFMFSLDVNDINNAQTSNIFTSADYPSLLVPGSHIVYVFHTNGCNKETLPFTITAQDVDPLTLVLQQGGLNTIEAISTGGSGGNTYTFNGDNNGSDNTYVYDQTGPYTVTVTDNTGCSVTVTQPFVFVPIFIPDVFTPDGDGNNDGWKPQNTSIYPNLKTKIYDRYGRLVAELNEGQSWDGKYHGNELPTGDYWYVLKVDGNDGQEFMGHFTLYR